MTPTAFQTSRLEPLAPKPAGSLLIHEIYRSVQGESTFAGLPCVFVRLTACSARCLWCDTPHAFKEGSVYSLDQVYKKVMQFGSPLVELTGGEPLLQSESFELMSRLADSGLQVLLETSGTVSIEEVDPRVHIIMDLKCPDSGECENNLFSNLESLKDRDEIKFVIASARDFEWAAGTIRELDLVRRFTVLMSPVASCIREVELAEWLLTSGLHVRMQLQLHKYIWGPETRGV
jgi:7-carboxy-7-deazaguanine synthase